MGEGLERGPQSVFSLVAPATYSAAQCLALVPAPGILL
jgi:hypothetical protein